MIAAQAPLHNRTIGLGHVGDRDGRGKCSRSLETESLSERYAMIAFHAHGASPARKEYAKLPMVGTLQIEAEHVAIDPAAGVKNPKRRKGAGFPAWTEEDAAAYDKRWPIGTEERVWRDVLFYTGLRRGDAVKLGRQHVRNGIATLRTEKSQGEITVCIPILPILQRTLDAGPTGELAFICGKNGKPLTKESFGNAFKDACKAAGLHNRSAQGCRKIAATRAAEAGATVAELNAIFGWRGTAMASLYTESADRKRLALEAMAKVQGANETKTSIPSPSRKVRAIKREAE